MSAADVASDALNAARSNRIAAQDLLDTVTSNVRTARTNGATWEQIGNALHITKQAAQQRYGHKDHWTTADTTAGHTPSIFSDS